MEMNENLVEDGVETTEEVQIKASTDPTSHTDLINLAMKGDGSVLLQLISLLPGRIGIENHRTVMNDNEAKMFVDNLCDLMDYYPQKDEEADGEISE